MDDIQHLIDSTDSSLLFHGPGAAEAAREAAGLYGRVLLDVDAPKGLKKEHSREAISLHLRPPLVTQGALVIGPLDTATPQSTDSLLKMVEEPITEARPFLWAGDVGSVSPTIRSRCLPIWSPGQIKSEDKDFSQALKDAVRGDPVAVFTLLQKPHQEVFNEIIEYLAAAKPTPQRIRLYQKLRPMLGRETLAGLSSALLGGNP